MEFEAGGRQVGSNVDVEEALFEGLGVSDTI